MNYLIESNVDDRLIWKIIKRKSNHTWECFGNTITNFIDQIT